VLSDGGIVGNRVGILALVAFLQADGAGLA
jgi:hypothetical protein